MNSSAIHKIMMLVSAIMIVLTTSCRSSKSSTAAQYNNTWHDIQIPVKLSLHQPVDISLSGRATFVKDSIINISLRVFGFEVATTRITTDSVFFVDKHNKYYFAEPLQALLGSHKMSVGQIQDMLLGQGVENHLFFENPASSQPVTVKMLDYRAAGPLKSVPSEITIDAPLGSVDIEAAVTWSLNSAKFNEYPRITFKKPGDGYRRIRTSSLKSMLKNF